MSVPFAHAVTELYTAPLPLWLYLVAAGAAVAGTFVLVVMRPPRPEPEPVLGAPGPYGLWSARSDGLRRGLVFAAEALSLLLWTAVLASLLAGPEDFLDSFGAVFFWVVFWCGLGVVSTFGGDLWSWLSPFQILSRRLVGPAIGDPDLVGRRAYPERLGRWPAVALLLGLTWMELIATDGRDPRVMGFVLTLYLIACLVGIAVYGSEAFTGNVELFAVVAATLARCSPLELRSRLEEPCDSCALAGDERELRVDCARCFARAGDDERAMGWRWPFSGVTRGPLLQAGGLAFVLAALGTVMYDGLTSTRAWSELIDALSGGEAPRLVGTLGLLACVTTLGILVPLAASAEGEGGLARARAYGPALIPIAGVYFVAHYFAYLVLIGQLAIPLASDPLGEGWNLLGTAGFETDPTLLPSSLIWYIEVALIVCGHIAGVLAARRIALAQGVRGALAELPMAALMVGYTAFGLWLLAAEVRELTAHVERAPAADLQERAERWLAEAIADGAPRWGWSRATDAAIVLGSAQRLGDWRPPAPYALLRRATGGGAVICDASYLMLDVALPAGDPRAGDDLAESYRWLAEELLAKLDAAGARGLRAVAPRELEGRSAADRTAARHACFAGLGPYEIVDAGGRKLVGLAQRRRRGAALFQAAAYLDGDRTPLADILPLEPDEREDLRRRLQRVANLAEVAAGFEPFAPSGAGAPTGGR